MERSTSPATAGIDSQREFLRQRARGTGIAMVVMGASFALYYLGFFGGVPGPLAPAQLGASLAGLGVTQRHVMVLLLSLLIITGTWNWIFNLASLATGSRMRCAAPMAGGRGACGEPVRRQRSKGKRSGRALTHYICPRGHRRLDAHFHPVRKGAVSHTLWVTALVFCLVAAFLG